MKRFVFYLIFFIFAAGCSVNTSQMEAVPVIETGINPDTFVTVPNGPFYAGQHDVETNIDYDYEIMIANVTNAQYSIFLNAALSSEVIRIDNDAVFGFYPGDSFSGHEHEEEISAGDRIFIPLNDPILRLSLKGSVFNSKAGFEKHPMTLVSWFGAWGYCQYYGWRLPTDLEWEKAARGIDNRPFPWGIVINEHYANYISSHDILERLFKGAGKTTPVGFYNGKTYQHFETYNNASPYGVYDMAGNVWEWTGDVRTGVHYRNLRGGSHTNYAYNLRIWTHNNAGPSYISPSVGFRCVKDK